MFKQPSFQKNWNSAIAPCLHGSGSLGFVIEHLNIKYIAKGLKH